MDPLIFHMIVQVILTGIALVVWMAFPKGWKLPRWRKAVAPPVNILFGRVFPAPADLEWARGKNDSWRCTSYQVGNVRVMCTHPTDECQVQLLEHGVDPIVVAVDTQAKNYFDAVSKAYFFRQKLLHDAKVDDALDRLL